MLQPQLPLLLVTTSLWQCRCLLAACKLSETGWCYSLALTLLCAGEQEIRRHLSGDQVQLCPRLRSGERCLHLVNRVSSEAIFATCPHDSTGGIMGVKRKGQVLSVTVDEANIVRYIARNNNNPVFVMMPCSCVLWASFVCSVS